MLFLVLGAWLFLGHRYLIFFIPLLFSFLTPKSCSSQFTVPRVCFVFGSVIYTLEAYECACFQKHLRVEGTVHVFPATAPLVWPPSVHKKHQPHITPPQKEIWGGGLDTYKILCFWASLHLEGTEWVSPLVRSCLLLDKLLLYFRLRLKSGDLVRRPMRVVSDFLLAYRKGISSIL